MPRTTSSTTATPSVQKLQTELQTLKGDFAQLAKQVEGMAGTAGNEMVGDIKARIESLSGSFDDLVTNAAARGREAVDNVGEIGSNMLQSAEESLHERPLVTLAIALGVGFVLSSAMRR